MKTVLIYKSLERKTIELEKGIISCLRIGSGQRLLIAFHGFGDSADSFRVLARDLGGLFTIWAVDLPGHGRSQWPAGTFNRRDILQIIETIRRWTGKDRYALLGFSFGGRIVLSLLEERDVVPEALFLIAPDGFGTRGMRLPLLTPLLLRRWLRSKGDQPQPWLYLASRLRKWGLLDAFAQRWVHFYFSNPARRKALWDTWLSLSHFPVHPRRLRRSIEQLALPSVFVLGRQDELIPYRRIEARLGGVAGCKIILADKNHWLVDRELGALLREAILDIDMKT